jgi:ring-1,2-phenylacetyl-CoA epoxidase subunit PaaD
MVSARIATRAPGIERLREIAAAVADPEIPVISIADLGILRSVDVDAQGRATITITPTYSGCPAIEAIVSDIESAVSAAGYDQVEVRTVLRPAWTTDWITERGRAVLAEFGIAPPEPVSERDPSEPVLLQLGVRCPRCRSTNTREVSRFGSTACKSLWTCAECLEPFDHFKALR